MTLVPGLLFAGSMVSAQTAAQAPAQAPPEALAETRPQAPTRPHSTWIYHGDGTATNKSTGQRVIVGLDMRAGSDDDDQVVNPVGKVLLKDVRVSLDPSATVYVDLGNGFSLYGGQDRLLGTTDDLVKGFGRYVQRDVPGAPAESLDWLLLDVEDSQAILFCNTIIDGAQFNLKASDGSDYARSNLRSWLNSRGGRNSSGDVIGFYDTAFDEAEKDRIVLARVSMSSSTSFRALDKSRSLPSGSQRWKDWQTTGTDTEDRVWALSGEEVFGYFGPSRIRTQDHLGHPSRNDANTYFRPSYYAVAKGVKVNEGGNGYPYIGFGDSWLRTAGPMDGADYTGCFLSSTGTIDIGRSVSALEGVQPVVRVTLAK